MNFIVNLCLVFPLLLEELNYIDLLAHEAMRRKYVMIYLKVLHTLSVRGFKASTLS